MSAIDIKEIGGCVADSELKFTQQGKAVCKVRLGFSDPVYDQERREWKDVNQFFVEATAWERTAEQLAEVATKGAQLLVWGKLVTDSWEDRGTGEKRSKPALKLKGFRPVGKLPEVGQQSQTPAHQSTGFGGGFGGSSHQSTDTWGGQPSGDGWGAPQSSEPPF